MTIANQTDLKTAMASWLHRSDLTGNLDDFIALAEQGIFRELRLRINEAVSTGTTSSDTITFPSTWGKIERVELTSNGVRYTLDYTSPNGIEDLTISTGLPSRYTVENGSIRLIPAPASAYSYSVYYIPNLTPLSGASPTNWAITNAPDVYLAASLAQAYLFMQDDARAKEWQDICVSAIEQVKRVDHARRFPTSGGLQIKPRGVR
jgi:hypothetical protein